MSGFTWTDAAVRSALSMNTDLADARIAYTGVSTDSRSVRPGSLYVALSGDRFDGHDFVAEAFAQGAAGAVVSRPVESGPEGRLYPVADTLKALGALAAHRRQALPSRVIAITGSSGKTTTKELTRAAIEGRYRVHATAGNFNNRIGMPLTLLDAPDDVDVVVLELGTNEPGEIATLAAIAAPDIGVVITVGEAHLEKLGSVDGVLEEKLDLLRAVAEGGDCVVGSDPEALSVRARAICPGVRVAGWGDVADDDLRPMEVEADVFGGHRFQWKGHVATLTLPGRHVVADAMIALAVSDLVGVPAATAVAGLSSVEATGMRGEVRRIGDVTVIVDCYNANPQSVRAALELLGDQSTPARTVAVLGTMLELGEAAPDLHREVLADALATGIDLVVAIGGFAEAAAAMNVDDERVLRADDWSVAYPELRARLAGDEVVLLKASRGIALEGMLPLLEADFGSSRSTTSMGLEG